VGRRTDAAVEEHLSLAGWLFAIGVLQNDVALRNHRNPTLECIDRSRRLSYPRDAETRRAGNQPSPMQKMGDISRICKKKSRPSNQADRKHGPTDTIAQNVKFHR
jgi:hypothetical protein